MFDDLLDRVHELGQTRISVALPVDSEGYFDRRCPSKACQADFKILADDWKQKVSNDHVFCPICREDARANEWNTAEQLAHIRQVAVEHVRSVLGGTNAQGVAVLKAAEELRQKFVCEQCGCRYSSLGAAFFCPACGHNSAESTFAQAIETVRKFLINLSAIQTMMGGGFDADAARNMTREYLESCMGRIVGAFQRLAEALFERSPAAGAIQRRKNVFQNLSEGSALWRTATGTGYEAFLTPAEMSDLLRLFQQRHLLEHCEGMVDQDYISKSGDTTYSVGQRLVIREAAVSRLADLVEKLASALRGLV